MSWRYWRYWMEVPWIVFVTCWAVGALKTVLPKPKKLPEFHVTAVTKESFASRYAILLLEIAGFVLLFGPKEIGFLWRWVIPRGNLLAWVGVVLTWAGIGIALWALWHLGYWSAQVGEGHKLIRSGPYAWLRHPIYAGLDVAAIGSALAIGRWRCGVGVCLIVIGYLIKARKEEGILTEHLKEAYVEYRQKTGFLLPRRGKGAARKPWPAEVPFKSVKLTDELHSHLLEAYKKHSAELASLEDRLNRTVLLILGLLGAGITAVSTVSLEGQWLAALGFSLIVLVVGWVGFHATREAADLRGAVRDLLVRCELAMQFYEPGKFVEKKALYDQAEREYATKGGSLTLTNQVVIIGTAGLLILLIWLNYLGISKHAAPIQPKSGPHLISERGTGIDLDRQKGASGTGQIRAECEKWGTPHYAWPLWEYAELRPSTVLQGDNRVRETHHQRTLDSSLVLVQPAEKLLLGSRYISRSHAEIGQGDVQLVDQLRVVG